MAITSDAAKKFVDSMTLTFDQWHDGLGYDLESLAAAPASEIPALEALLIARRPRDWRDIEALAALGTPNARAVIEEARQDADPLVRRKAAACAEPMNDAPRLALLLEALKTARPFGGLTEALDEVEQFHPPAVIDALLRGCLHRDGETAVHLAAMLFFLHGKADEPFDWNHRPFFLRFHTSSRNDREAVFQELCNAIGVDASPYLKNAPGKEDSP